jgi:uncharacterized protein (DUF2236 family)
MTHQQTLPDIELESRPGCGRQRHLGTAVRDRLADDAGLFGPRSMMRRVNGEALGLLGGGRAILLQLAHPLVAAGVNDYSRFQADPLARLFGTLEMMHTIIFDEPPRVRRALKRFHAMHARIRGRLPRDAGRFPAGTFYSGDDPQLGLWVFATLVDTSLITYQQFVAPLSPDERASYYADTLRLARLLGIPDADLPPTLADFGNYMDTMLAGDSLAVTDTAKRLAWSVLDPDVPNVGRVQYACAWLLRFVTAGLLSERFRAAYGLPWGARQQRLLDAVGWTTRQLRPVAPAWLWRSPQLDGASVSRLLLWPSR